ncbi:MAG: LruC domain-containing protein [Bacteroidales bacterium]|nr:LruC domain-containing protein [Bacteroidales bacterium]
MKSRNLFLVSIVITVLSFSLTGCKKTLPDPPIPAEKEMEDLTIPNGFNFTSTTNATIEVIMPFTVDYSDLRSRVEILTAPANEGGVVLNTGSVNSSGRYLATITVPSFLDRVFVSTSIGTAWVSLIGTKSTSEILEGGVNFGNGYDTIPPPDTTALMKMGSASTVIKGRVITDAMLLDNLITNGTFDLDDFIQFNDWGSPMLLNQKWYYTSSFQTAFSRYNDNGNYCARVTVPSGNYRSGGIAQLIEASSGDEITLTADFKHLNGSNASNRAWLYIIPRDAAGTSIDYFDYEIPNASNVSNWNSYTISATMPSGTVTVQILLWQWIFAGQHYWDNIVVTGPVTDTDGDGVNDEEDAYPNDATRAYNVYYPSSSTFNTLVFEDNWPAKADYDFNDLVVDYQYKQVTNASNALVDLYGKFVIRAIGASFENGFGFEMEVSPALISNVTGTSITEGYITLLANNSEASQTKGTIIVTDNAFTQLPHPGGGTGVNTTPGAPYVTPDTMDIAISFTQPVTIAQAGTPPYNPFLIVDKTRGREVHLPDNPPTSLADLQYFGTFDDDSDPATGKYYKTATNLPWALNIATEFDYPKEEAVIIDAYLYFGTWAESAGATHTNWYLDVAGNRDSDYIYSH